MIRVGIVDDHPLFVNGIREALEAIPDAQLLSSWGDAASLRAHFKIETPDVLLLDLNLPDADGMELCREVLNEHPNLMIIALTTLQQHALVKALLRNGARGYLLKTVTVSELGEAIRSVAAGKIYLQNELRETLISKSLGQESSSGTYTPKLTRRELEVLKLIIDEHTSQEIADRLFVSVKTVETHRMNLMQKLGVRNTAGLVKMALSKGLIND